MMRRYLTIALACFFLIGVLGCGSYYKVVDPATDKTYYTEKIKKINGGAIKLKDANSGAEVTIQNSEVTEINKEEFRANTSKD
jgi:hypothetical protein